MRVSAKSDYDLRALIAVRFVQGLFVPALTTCLAAWTTGPQALARL